MLTCPRCENTEDILTLTNGMVDLYHSCPKCGTDFVEVLGDDVGPSEDDLSLLFNDSLGG